MALTTTTQIPPPINMMFTRRFLVRGRYKTHYFHGTSPARVTKHGGTSTALWRRFEHMTPTTTPLAELTSDDYPTRPGSQPTVTDVTKAVAKYGDHIVLTEEADVFNFNGTTTELTDVLASQAGRSVNMVVRNEMEDNATQTYTGGVSDVASVNAIVAATDLDRIINQLNRLVAEPFDNITTGSNATATNPIMPAFYGVCHPDVAHDISGLSGFKSVESYAGQVSIRPNEFGFYGKAGLGIRFVSSPDASIDAGAGATGGTNVRETATNADVYATVIYGENATGTLGLGNETPTRIMDTNQSMPVIEIINKPMGSAGTADPLDEKATLGWKAWTAAKILNGNWIRSLRSAATEI